MEQLCDLAIQLGLLHLFDLHIPAHLVDEVIVLPKRTFTAPFEIAQFYCLHGGRPHQVLHVLS